ncbi:redox-regulated ATPase YchF [Alphaproteobacteria bacterium endosymbiont of Tiliacea citrago]|uniref:redox-regulated ATPase YchF n=1 Tax=Alphaproteobacteria bacterium endosymbiont of Tiliacea citrago TaxID=3077944 RepID=UPI00313DD499
MSLSCGFVGLPNVGKSTLFNAILKKTVAASANYPFCTIEPNIGKVPLEDNRLELLSKISHSSKIIHALLTCHDIAGLVKGANKGEGLGNQFLSHIRECDLIIQVLRCFEDKEIIHVENSVDPIRDYDTINLELQCSDLERLEKILYQKKTDINLKNQAEIAKNFLYSNSALRDSQWDKDFVNFFNTYGFLTYKPMLIVGNVSTSSDDEFFNKIKHLNPIKIFAAIEVMLQDIESEEDKKNFLIDLGIQSSGLNELVRAAYNKLGLMNYFTTGKEETRAWEVHKGDTMQDAAGVIHTDFYNHFISADVVKFDDFIKYNGWSEARENGVVKTCAKDSLIEDGDICLFKSYKK